MTYAKTQIQGLTNYPFKDFYEESTIDSESHLFGDVRPTFRHRSVQCPV